VFSSYEEGDEWFPALLGISMAISEVPEGFESTLCRRALVHWHCKYPPPSISPFVCDRSQDDPFDHPGAFTARVFSIGFVSSL